MKKLFLLFLLVIFIFVASIQIFKVKNARLQNSSGCLEEKVLLSKVHNKNLIPLNTEKLKEDIRKQSACLEDIKITKKYPNTVIFEVVEKKTVATIDGSEFSATEDGLVIQDLSSQERPKLFLPQGVQVKLNETITNASVLYALKLIKNLEKTDFTPASVRIVEQGDIAVYRTQEAIALFTQQSSVDLQVDSLQSVIAKAKIDPSKIAKIDLRFDKPVLIYK